MTLERIKEIYQDFSNTFSRLKEAYRVYLISDGDGWISMLDDRNMTAHIYNESKALEIYKKIKDAHLKLFLELIKKASEFL